MHAKRTDVLSLAVERLGQSQVDEVEQRCPRLLMCNSIDILGTSPNLSQSCLEFVTCLDM